MDPIKQYTLNKLHDREKQVWELQGYTETNSMHALMKLNLPVCFHSIAQCLGVGFHEEDLFPVDTKKNHVDQSVKQEIQTVIFIKRY